MSILIDSCVSRNVGDSVMLESVVNFLRCHLNSQLLIIQRSANVLFGSASEMALKIQEPGCLYYISYWRIREFDSQRGIVGFLAKIIFWSIFFIRAVFLWTRVLFFHKFKKHLICPAKLRLWVEALATSDGYWLVGNGSFNDTWIKESFWKIAYAYIHKTRSVPVIFSGQGVGPLKNAFSKLLVFFGLRQATLVSLREKLSDSVVKQNFAQLSNCRVVCDDAIGYPGSNLNIVARLPENFIALNFRFGTYSKCSDYLLVKLVNFLDYFSEKDSRPFVFVPISFNQEDSDVKSAKRLMSMVQQKDRFFLVDKPDYYFAASSLANASLAIGGSYHFCFFSLSRGIPTVGIYLNAYYQQKLEGLMQMFELMGNTFRLDLVETESLYRDVVQFSRKFNKEFVVNRKSHMFHNWDVFMKEAVSKF